MVSIAELKDSIAVNIKPFLCSSNLQPTGTLGGFVAIQQVFYPFSNSLSSYSFYVDSIESSPCTLVCNIKTGTLSIDSTIGVSLGWNVVDVNKRIISYYPMTISLMQDSGSCNLAISALPSNIVTYVDGARSSFSICQKLGVEEWIKPSFPYSLISREMMPQIRYDIYQSPSSKQPYLDYTITQDLYSMKFDIYSIYNAEVDMLIRILKKSIMGNRSPLFNAITIFPAGISQLMKYIDEIVFRSVTFNIMLLNRNVLE